MFVSLFENDFMFYDKYGNVGSNIKTNTRLYTVCQWNIKDKFNLLLQCTIPKRILLMKTKKKQKKKRKISYKVHEHTLVVYLAPRKKEPCHLIAILECSQAIDE